MVFTKRQKRYIGGREASQGEFMKARQLRHVTHSGIADRAIGEEQLFEVRHTLQMDQSC